MKVLVTRDSDDTGSIVIWINTNIEKITFDGGCFDYSGHINDYTLDESLEILLESVSTTPGFIDLEPNEFKRIFGFTPKKGSKEEHDLQFSLSLTKKEKD